MRSLVMGFGMLFALSSVRSRECNERTCTGEFTDMRVTGLTLGDCDLNSKSNKELFVRKERLRRAVDVE